MIIVTIDKCLNEMGLSMRQLAIAADVRPNTVIELKNNKAKRVDFDTLDKLLNGLNKICIQRGIERRFGLSDIITYKLDWVQLEIPVETDDE